MRMTKWLAAMAATTLIAACGGGTETSGAAASTSAADGAASAGMVQPAPGGTVHTVEMLTDPTDGANKFVPSDLTVKQGDVIRYVLKTGVHNVHFLPDSNANKSGLPEAGPMLQAPGQTHDVAVSFGAGRYYYQCDPHAALGMIGHVTVQ